MRGERGARCAVLIAALAGCVHAAEEHREEQDLARDFGQLAAFKDLGKSEEGKATP